MNKQALIIPVSGTRQQGVALFISLMILLIVTVLGLSAIQMTSLQEQMARNASDISIAFLAAESAINDAEALIESKTSLVDFKPITTNKNGLYTEAAVNAASNQSQVDWQADTAANTFYISAATPVAGAAEQPKYIIEHLKSIVAEEDTLNLDNIGQGTGSGLSEVFRVTVYGTGGTADAHVMVQSTYGKRF